MHRRWIFYIGFLLPVLGLAEETRGQMRQPEIEQEIEALNEKLHEGRLKEMDEEVKGQGLMIADWDAYSKELEEVRKQEEENRQMEGEIQKLEQRKADLLKSGEQGI